MHRTGSGRFDAAKQILVRVCYCIALAILAACASKPEPRVVPLKQAIEIPISSSAEMEISARQGTYRYGNHSALPEPDTREWAPAKLCAPSARGIPDFSAECTGRDFSRALAGAFALPILGAVLVGGALDAATGGPQNREEERESNLRMTAPLRDLVSDTVVRQGLNDALAEAFKATLGWTRPYLTVPPSLADWHSPEAKRIHTVNLPALEISATRVELLELRAGSRTLVLCAQVWVYGGTDFRRFDSCRQENWDTAFFSKDSDREAFLGSLTAATTRLGQAMAKGVIKQ